jgi:hypothetical protein
MPGEARGEVGRGGCRWAMHTRLHATQLPSGYRTPAHRDATACGSRGAAGPRSHCSLPPALEPFHMTPQATTSASC